MPGVAGTSGGDIQVYDSSLAPFGNRETARDFLSFVEEFHPMLTPYRTFRLGNRRAALDRRTIRLMDDIARRKNLYQGIGKSRMKWLWRPGKIAERVGIYIPEVESWRLRVHLWPASTASQADRFSTDVDKDRFLTLHEEDWTVEPNLNFSFSGTKLIWAEGTCGAGAYLDYFFSGERHYGRKRFDNELSSFLLNEWQSLGLITQKYREAIESQRTQTNRKYLDVNPEFSVYRDWDQNTVINLEEQGKLEADIIENLDIPLATWGEHL